MNTSELQKIKQRYNIVGNSDGLNRALDVALQVAPTDLSVLIVGLVPLLSLWRSIRIRRASRISSCSSRSCS